MWRATIKSVFAHKLRLALTALAIVLGVSFVAGSLVLTDTLGATFDTLFAEANAGTDAVVRSEATFSGTGSGGVATDREPLAASLLRTIRAVPGVETAEGYTQGYAQLVDTQGKAIASQAPTFGGSWVASTKLNPFTIKTGRAPRRPGEVVIDAATAAKYDFEVGERVRVLLQGPPEQFTVVGTAGFGAADNLAGATFALFEPKTAQRVLGRQGRFDQILVVADEDLSSTQLVRRLSASLPTGVEALSGVDEAKEAAQELKGFLGYFRTALLVFAGVALFVGSFIIVNTFSILVAQRTRELALLRAIGASRRQVTRSVLGEAFIVAVVASFVGLGLGVLLAIGLKALLSAFGLDLPSSDIQFLPRTAIVSVAVGVVITCIAALLPARRAARVAPVEAMRDSQPASGRSLRRRAVTGGFITALGATGLLAGLSGRLDNGIAVVGLGAVVTFIGVAALSPVFARPLAALVGAPVVAMFGVPGRLGRENAMRSPRRTAATAAALMIGLALVVFVTILLTSIQVSAGKAVDQATRADYVVAGSSNQFQGFSPALADRLRALPEVEAAVGLRFGEARIDGATAFMSGADHRGLEKVVNLDLIAGDAADLGDGGLLVWDEKAQANGWKVGDTIEAEFPRTGGQRLRIDGIYGDNRSTGGDYLISLVDFEDNFTSQLDTSVLIKAAEDTTPAAARAAIEKVTAGFSNVELSDRAELKEQQKEQISQLLNLMYALLGLAILIALIGITNTLALSIFERIRELGLLRAVGASRRQLRRMIRWESVIISVIGAILGVVVGVFFGWAVVTALADEGIDTLSLPMTPLVVYLVVTGLAGMAAAVLPARRASRLNVLAAIAHE